MKIAIIGGTGMVGAAAVAEAAKTAFTHAMQITTVFALVLIAASAAVVWRVIPSPRPDRGPSRDH